MGTGDPAAAGMPQRTKRELILDATLRVIEREGLDRVTHRAIAAEADVPLGLTTYYFGSRDEIVEEALSHACRREIHRLGEQAEALRRADISPAQGADVIASRVAEQVEGTGRAELVAQYVLQLHAARRPGLRSALDELNEANRELAEAALRAVGARRPERDAELVIAAVDGMRLHELAQGGLRQDELRRRIERLLRALAGG